MLYTILDFPNLKIPINFFLSNLNYFVFVFCHLQPRIPTNIFQMLEKVPMTCSPFMVIKEWKCNNVNIQSWSLAALS
jgi:hypothetical protein